MKLGKYNETKAAASVNTSKNFKWFINTNIENNECYTCRDEADKLVSWLLQHKIITSKTKVWLPFNDVESNIYKALYEMHCCNLIATDEDFFAVGEKYKGKCDIIISNPPFKGRTPLFKKLLQLDIPFILLQPYMFFNNNSIINMLCETTGNWQFLFPKNRMGFIVNGIEKSHTTAFYSF